MSSPSLHYRYVADSNNYDGIDFHPYFTLDVLRSFDGRSHAASWKEIDVHPYVVGRQGDFPGLANHMPVFSERAWAALSHLVEVFVEALPMRLVGGRGSRLLLINVVDVIDCLDPGRAVLQRYDDGHISEIHHHAFREELVVGHHLFRIKDQERRGVIVDEVFRDTVERHGLRGLIFEELP